MELICSVQKYHWGNTGKNSLVGKFYKANSNAELNENASYAEFWMGTHPNGPSYLKKSNMKLSDHLMLHPEELGSKVVNHFGNQLPFLFKILSIKIPLSIQAHPTKSHAEELFAKFPNIYKDANHKPEIAMAVTKFEALCGFRPVSEIKKFLRDVKEFQLLIATDLYEKFLQNSENSNDFNNRLMKDCFHSLMSNKQEVVTIASKKLINRLQNTSQSDKDKCLYNLVERIYSSFPEDVGIFCIYWLNYLVLSPGEALYLAPNEPHAYLYGDCIECMANSDNVVRAGLTPKFRDIETLCQMLTYKSYQSNEILFSPFNEDEYSLLYSPPIIDFAVCKIDLPENCKYTLKKRESASILLVFEGLGELDSMLLEVGKVLFVPAKSELNIKSNGLILFQAFCNI